MFSLLCLGLLQRDFSSQNDGLSCLFFVLSRVCSVMIAGVEWFMGLMELVMEWKTYEEARMILTPIPVVDVLTWRSRLALRWRAM